MKNTVLLLITITLSLALPAQADVRIFPLFCDNAVLQRDVPMPVYGTADKGEEVTVTFAGKTQATMARDGKWKVVFEPMPAGGPHTLTVNGRNTLTAENILVGDVWLCTGQSNMAGLLRAYVNMAPEILKGHPGDYKNDNIRLMKFATTAKDTPQGTPPMAEGFETWRTCEPDAVLLFSATGYFFGINLQTHIGVPVGLIQTCVGGTPAESWTPKEVLETNPEYRHILDGWQRIVDAYPKRMRRYQDTLAAWKSENLKPGQKLSDLSPRARKRGGMPKPPRGPDNPKRPAALYNGMIAPIHGYPIKGAVWYQGEANAHSYDRAIEYGSLLPDMIQSWRERWGVGSFPFFWVQLAPFRKVSDTPQDTEWSWMRETMDKIQNTVPNGGMACIIDAGAQDNIHPPYKEITGARLALQARKVAYGQDIIASGPVFAAMKKRSGKAIVTFDNAGDGLEQRELHLDLGQVTVNGDILSGFTICGKDKKFVPAQAKIKDKNTVQVWSDQVKKPVAVRYAWANFPLANLYNSAGLPTGPFRTDDFPPPAAIVSPVTLKLGTIADVTVDEGAITRNFGDESYLGVGGGRLHHRQSFLMFYIKGPGKVLSARLKMMAGEVNTADTTVHAVNNVSWGEDEVTWKSRPSMGAALGTLTDIVPGRWHEWDVSGYVEGSGFLALGLTSTDTGQDGAAKNWCSRERDRNLKPYLEVTFDKVCTPSAPQDPYELEFFQPESQPRMLDFRGMQNPAVDGMRYLSWEAMAAQPQGIIGKALYENEKTQDFMPNCEAYYTEYKKNHPEKLAMIHISANGRLRTPGNISNTPFQTDDFFPGHWLYWQGQRIARDIGVEETTLFVEDVMYFKKNDVVGVFELSEGQIQWRRNEYVLVKGIDRQHNCLKVLRGQFATRARPFIKGRSYAAPVATSMYPETWSYNLALSCPKDEAGRTCVDRIMELYEEWLAPSGYFEGMNGIALDADVFYSEKKHRRPGWRHHDVNGDQIADAGFINGVNDYGLGKLDFHQRLRGLLGPDRLISGDITSSGSQRSVGLLNGGESEIFPHQGDNEHLRMWSNGVNKFHFWMSNAVEPRYCFSPIKEGKLKEKTSDPMRLMRLHNAAIQLLGGASGVQPLKKDGRIYDEMVKGVAQQPNWLGAKVGDTIHLGLQTPDLLNGAGIDLNAEFVNAWSSEDAVISKVGNELKITGRSENQSSMVATFKNVDLPAGSLLAAFDVRAEPRPEYPNHLPRLIWVSADEASHLCVLPPKSMHFTCGMAGIPETPLNVLSLSIDNPEVIDTSFSTRCDAYRKEFKDENEEHWGYMTTLPSWKPDDSPWVAWSKKLQLPSAPCELVFYTYTGPNPWRSGLGSVRYEVFIEGEKVHSSENDASEWKRNTVDLSGWAGQEVTLRFVASPGAAYKNANPVWGPAWIAPQGEVPYIRPDDIAAHQLLTYANANTFPASFYFRDLGSGSFNITLNIEGDEPVYLSNFRVYNADDVMAGEYEHGVILANPSSAASAFNLAALFPGSTFRRITGTANQDPATNNGSAVGATVMVPPCDGLFLIRETTRREVQ